MEITTNKISVLFPGLGCQYPRMCIPLIQRYRYIKDIFDEASDVLTKDLVSLISEGSMFELTVSKEAQSLIVVTSYALFEILKRELGVTFCFLAGHSLGEITAMVIADCLSFSEAVCFTKGRGQLMQRAAEAVEGSTGLAVDIMEEKLRDIVSSIAKNNYVCISGYNSPNQLMVAGTKAGVKAVAEGVYDYGGEFIPFKMMPMKVDAPYHSHLMMPYQLEYQELLDKISFSEPDLPVWSTVTGGAIKSAEEISEILLKQLVLPVQWSQILTALCNKGVELFIDIGPSQIIKNLVNEDESLSPCLSFDDAQERRKIFSIYRKGAIC